MSEGKQIETTNRRRRTLRFIGLVAVIVLATVFGLALLVNTSMTSIIEKYHSPL